MLGTPVATQPPPVGGAPADEDVETAITATMSQLVACINAGDNRLLMALYSDDFLAALLGGIGAIGDDITEAQIRQEYAQTTPAAAPSGEIAQLEAITDVQRLPDGRVSAIARINGEEALTIFVETDGRYLIDFVYESSAVATPEP